MVLFSFYHILYILLNVEWHSFQNCNTFNIFRTIDQLHFWRCYQIILFHKYLAKQMLKLLKTICGLSEVESGFVSDKVPQQHFSISVIVIIIMVLLMIIIECRYLTWQVVSWSCYWLQTRVIWEILQQMLQTIYNF